MGDGSKGLKVGRTLVKGPALLLTFGRPVSPESVNCRVQPAGRGLRPANTKWQLIACLSTHNNGRGKDWQETAQSSQKWGMSKNVLVPPIPPKGTQLFCNPFLDCEWPSPVPGIETKTSTHPAGGNWTCSAR